MKQLVIDGSFENINLSVFDEQELVYDLHVHSACTHSKILTDIFNCALNPLSLNLQDIERIYCCIGPGKYTSLRVILATIKGMLFDKFDTVYGFTSLDLMAAEENGEKAFRVVCKTSKTKTYFADYLWKDSYITRIGSIESAAMEKALDTDKKIITKNSIESTKNILKINQRQIKKVDLYELAPIY